MKVICIWLPIHETATVCDDSYFYIIVYLLSLAMNEFIFTVLAYSYNLKYTKQSVYYMLYIIKLSEYKIMNNLIFV